MELPRKYFLHHLVEHELGKRFRIPRVPDDASTSTWPLLQGGRGFVPYTTKAKNKKCKVKRKVFLRTRNKTYVCCHLQNGIKFLEGR